MNIKLFVTILIFGCSLSSHSQTANSIKAVQDVYFDYLKTKDFRDIIFKVSQKLIVADLNMLKPSNKVLNEDEYVDLINKLLDDEYNPIYYYEMAEHYNAIGEYDDVDYYYQTALDLMDLRYFKSNEDKFYALRGLLKMNLGEDKPLDDFEKALALNPKNEMASKHYPRALLNEKNFDEIDKKLRQLLSAGGDEKTLYYHLQWNELNRISDKLEHATRLFTYPEIRTLFANFPLQSIKIKDKNFKELADNQFSMYQHLILWRYFFILTQQNKPRETKNEKAFQKMLTSHIKQTESLRKKKGINDYLYYKTLGYDYLFLNQQDKAQIHLKKALEFFPKNNREENIDEGEIYSALICNASLSKQDQQVIQYIEDYELIDLWNMHPEFRTYKYIALLRTNNLVQAELFAFDYYNTYFSEITNRLAMLLYLVNRDDIEEASSIISGLNEYITSYREHYEALVVLGGALEVTGQIEDAKTLFNQAKELNASQQFYTDEKQAFHTKMMDAVKLRP